MKKILIVEDEKTISDIIKINLTKEGYEIITAYDGKEALNIFEKTDLDLILLDVMLPYVDGFQVCRKIRSKSNVPIILLTAKEEEVDKVLGLELGADDYITKPFGMRELIARVKANMRRVELDTTVEEAFGDKKIIKSDNLLIDITRYEVRKNDKVIELTKREFELLTFLASRDTQVFTREQLLKDVWGYEYFGDIRTVDVTVRRMREKIEDDSSNPKFIMTKRGVGYYFRRL
ncbi:MAG: response regulator transcription factor [Clostridiales bacterium]|nr:response regulator transcription factor [Clostridiales bacterium]